MKRAIYWVVLGIFLIPTFSLMTRPGIFTMHDPHLFRIFEFNRCFSDGQFPCRWAPDSGKGFGEPLFNFYAQAPYWLTQAVIVLGFSILDSAKIVYALSLVLSALTMYIYTRRFWGNLGGLVSALFYVYAPYRAVDIWVRGALPEALAFVLYPLLLLFLDLYLESNKKTLLLCFSIALALLINIHNLSFLMFSPFLAVYWLIKSLQQKKLSSFWPLAGAGIFSLALSTFYLLPVIFESSLVTISNTVTGYYDYHIHFTTLRELFISRFWGYGASLWAQKFLSVSIGHLHWIIPVILLVYILIKKRFDRFTVYCLMFTLLGFTALFLTHGKSSFIWNLIPVMKFIQFPWRFLSIAVFFLSLSVGYLVYIIPRKIIFVLLLLLLLLNYNFFRPDIWRNISDQQQFSGFLWDEGRSSSLTDFWPVYGSQPPDNFAFRGIRIVSGGNAWSTRSEIRSQSAQFQIIAEAETTVAVPIVYFPGWQVKVNGVNTQVSQQGKLGLVSFSISKGVNMVAARFTNTPIRTTGNVISLLALLSTPIWFLKKQLG